MHLTMQTLSWAALPWTSAAAAPQLWSALSPQNGNYPFHEYIVPWPWGSAKCNLVICQKLCLSAVGPYSFHQISNVQHNYWHCSQSQAMAATIQLPCDCCDVGSKPAHSHKVCTSGSSVPFHGMQFSRCAAVLILQWQPDLLQQEVELLNRIRPLPSSSK